MASKLIENKAIPKEKISAQETPKQAQGQNGARKLQSKPLSGRKNTNTGETKLCSQKVGNLNTGSNSYFPSGQVSVSSECSKIGEGDLYPSEDQIVWGNPRFEELELQPPSKTSMSAVFAKGLLSGGKWETDEEQKFVYNSKKIFVGGLPHGLTEVDFNGYFSKYGEIEDSVVMYDRNTKKPRGFGFITYKDENSIDLVLNDKFKHKIHNKWIEWKRATPKVNLPSIGALTFDQAMAAYYDYNITMMPMQNTWEQLASSCNEASPAYSSNKIETQVLIPPPEINSNAAIAKSSKGLQQNASIDLNSSHSSWELDKSIRKEPYFTELIPAEDKMPVLEKIEKLRCDEDKFTTYSEIFEDFNKSENGSDWNIAMKDPFDIKDCGFPQPLPTSDVGSIFNKYGSGTIGEQPPDNNQLALSAPDGVLPDPIDLIPSSIKNEVINLTFDESDSKHIDGEDFYRASEQDCWYSQPAKWCERTLSTYGSASTEA